MTASTAYPIQILQEHVTGLEAAISVCLAEPGHKPVHRLRTETRRVEALLLLLDLIPELPEHRREAAALTRALGKLRRVAGKVRDLDVHRRMLEALAESGVDSAGVPAESKAVESGQEPADKGRAKTKARRGAKAATFPEATQTHAGLLQESAKELRKQLGHERDKAAIALQDVLRKRQVKTSKAAEDLLLLLEAARDFALPGPDLLRDAEAIFSRDGLLRSGPVTKLDKGDLHTIRKAAKAARYLAESLPENATLVAAARRFETLQEAGGQWHDAMELARAARRYFGKSHELTAAYREDRSRKLESYQKTLASTANSAKPASSSKDDAPGGSKRTASRAGKPTSGKAAATAA